MKLETYLSYSPLFQNIAAPDSAELFGCLTDGTVDFKKNDTIVKCGEPQSCIGLLVRGSAYAFAHDRSGEKKYAATLNTGDCFGLENIFRFQAGEARTACWTHSVVAARDCQAAFLKVERILKPCEKDCARHRILTRNLISAISSALYGENRRNALLTIKNMRGRIAVYLLQRIEEEKEDPTMISLPFNRNRMAAYLDVSRPSMSRELAGMKEDGILDYYLDTIQILDMGKLQTVARKSSR